MSDDSLLGHLAEEFTCRLREGNLPDIEEYAVQYPQLAVRIRELFPTLMLLEGMAAKAGLGSPENLPSGLSPGSVFGLYRIEREIGRGGMGIVYEAVHSQLEKRVALKVLPVRMPEVGHPERFFREARTAAGLHHTNIVPVFDVGQVAGTPYYAMQYIEGRGLDQVLRVMRPLEDGESGARYDGKQVGSPSAVARSRAGLPVRSHEYFRWVAGLGIQAAAGLAYAHARNVIHRDVKPSNLLLDSQGVLWIADFGLARKIEDAGLTQSGILIGTPRYMSPEQAESERHPVDQRTDIYSLGVTLYELLTCRPVFDGRTPQEVLIQIVTREPVSPRGINREIPEDLETIILKAMSKQPEDRYQSAREFGEDLDRWRRMEPIKARPVGIVGRTIRWCRRNPRLAAVTTVAAAIILTLSAVFYWSLIRENANTRLALQRETEARNQAAAALRASETYRNSAQIGQLAAQSESLLRKDPELSLLLALEAAKGGRTEAGEKALREALVESRIRTVLRASMGTVIDAGFSPDGRTLLTLDYRFEDRKGAARIFYNAIRVWDRSTGRELTAIPLTGQENLMKATFCCGGRRILTEGDTLSPPLYTPSPAHLRLWDAASGKQILEFTGNGHLSSDGRHFAAIWDSALQFWDLEAGKVAAEMRLDQPKGFHVVAVSANSALAAIAGEDGAVRVWDTRSNKFTVELRGHKKRQMSAAFSRDARMLVTACLPSYWDQPRDPSIRVWNVRTGAAIKVIDDFSESPQMVEFSPDQRFMAAVYLSGIVRLWDARTWKNINTLRGRGSWLGSGDVSPDSRLLITGGGDTPRIWDAWSGKLIAELRGHSGAIRSTRFSPDGTQVLTGSDDGTARIWDVRAGLESMELAGLGGRAWGADFSPDGTRLVTTGQSEKVLVWDTRAGTLFWSAADHNESVTTAQFSPDGRLLLTAGRDARTLVYETDTGKMRAEIRPGSDGQAMFSSDGLRVLTGGRGQPVKAWDSATGSFLRQLTAPDYTGDYFDCSPDGRYIISGKVVAWKTWLWEVVSGKIIAELPACPASFSPDTRRLIGADTHGWVFIWQVPTKAVLAKLESGYSDGILSSFSPDGRHVVINGVPAKRDKQLAQNSVARMCSVWEAVSWRKLAEIECSAVELKYLFSPDGQFLAVSQGKLVKVVELATGRKVADLNRQRDAVNRVSYSPDGKYIATANQDGTTIIYPWEMFAPYDELLVLARSRVTRSLSCEERNLYLQGSPCPAITDSMPDMQGAGK